MEIKIYCILVKEITQYSPYQDKGLVKLLTFKDLKICNKLPTDAIIPFVSNKSLCCLNGNVPS